MVEDEKTLILGFRLVFRFYISHVGLATCAETNGKENI